jgi:signal transduction histidine kinase
MNGFAQLLLDRADTLDAEARDCCEEIAANATRMGTLVDALLGLSRLSRAELRREAVDVSALAHEVARELAAVEPERAVEMRIADELHADADPRLLRVMLVNLLGNARKFASKVPHPVVELGTTQAATTHGNRIHAWYIRDNGAGFDPRYASKLFAPFQRLHAARDFPGTGIGLATVQRIVHRHGGEIWAEGEVGKGATFYFTLAAS